MQDTNKRHEKNFAFFINMWDGKNDPASTFWYKFYRNINGIFYLSKRNNKTNGLQHLRDGDAYILYPQAHENNAEFDWKVQENKHRNVLERNPLSMNWACWYMHKNIQVEFEFFPQSNHSWQSHYVCLFNLEKKTIGNSLSHQYLKNCCTHLTQI